MIPLVNRLKVDHSPAVITRAVKLIHREFPQDVEVAKSLATILAESGNQFSKSNSDSADVASTGGPTSLSTLLTPLYLRAAGIPVTKLGVPGRPAGGIDCLAQISGYKWCLSMSEAESILQRTGFVHFLAQGEAAPLDRKMFTIRQKIGALAIPTLVVASLIAKKLAVKVKIVGLDIRVATHGNFGANWSEARANAAFFAVVAKTFNMSATPVLTCGEFPYQPYFGRSESLLALALIFDGKADGWLRKHDELCRNLALQCAPAKFRPIIAKITPKQLYDAFVGNVQAQSGSLESFIEAIEIAKRGHNVEITALKAGFVSFNLPGLRDLFVSHQRQHQSAEAAFPDPIGLIFLRYPGEWVERGTPLATIRISSIGRRMALNRIKSLVYTQPLSIGPAMESVL